MLLLLKTYLDVIAMRAGPERIPKSGLVLLMSLAMLLLAGYCATVLIDLKSQLTVAASLVSYAAGFVGMLSVVALAGHSARLLQTASAIIGCDAVLTLLHVATYVIFGSLVDSQVGLLLAMLVAFWAVPVDGHIIATAIGQPWYVGFLVALSCLAIQIGLQLTLAGS